jgi:ribonuclease HIII
MQAGESFCLGVSQAQKQPAPMLAPDAGHGFFLDPLGPEPWKVLRVAAGPSRTKFRHGADEALRLLAQADGGAEFHHRLVVHSGVGAGHECVRQRGEKFCRLRTIAKQTGVAGQPGEDTHDIAVNARGGFTKRDAGDRSGGVGADAGQLPPFGRAARRGGPGDDALRKFVQVARARIVPESFPKLHDPVFGRRRQRGKIREFAQPAVEIRQDGGNLGLLQHELRDHGLVERRRLAPRQPAGAGAIPTVERGLEGGTMGKKAFGLGHKRHKRRKTRTGEATIFVFVLFALFVAIQVMPKRSDDAGEETPKAITNYTIKLDDAQMGKLRSACAAKYWEEVEVPYARFAFKGPKVNVTAYTSGKVVVAGKETADFVQNVIEAEVTGQARLGYDEVHHPEWFEPHAGLDESGKGDLFGPVVTATVVAEKAAIEAWIKAGVRDSKTIVDAQILKLDELIRATPGVVVETCFCGMAKYNELMLKPHANLNRLLAWQHAVALEKALKKKWVARGLLDQFSKEPLVQRELKKRGLERFNLEMRTKAESDPVVAAASVVARAEFVRAMRDLAREYGDKLQFGAGAQAKAQAALILEKFGAAALGRFAKLHFRTSYEVVEAAGKLDELPLPRPKEKTEWRRG